MASDVSICNRALQLLGANRITSLSENSVNARACDAVFAEVRDAELRAHCWNFATTRVQLAADSSAPEFGREYSYTLPGDFIRLSEPYPEENSNDRDWVVEGGKIYTNDSAPLNVRYIKRVTDANVMDPLFRKALAIQLAVEICEVLTQSNAKKESLKDDYTTVIREAKRTNGIESVAAEPATDSWITARA